MLFVANRGDDTLVEIDTDTMTCGRRVKTRSDPNRIYRTSAPDGRDLLLLTNSGEQSISVFDARQLEEIERVALPANPTALSFHPSRRVAYVSFQDDYVRELDLDAWRFVGAWPTLREPDASYVLAGAR
jgi:DNA-binding beta-propeller fold protein YncE